MKGYKERDGKLYVRKTFRDAAGKRHEIWRKVETKTEAKHVRREIENQLAEGIESFENHDSLNEYLDTWLNAITGRVTDKTQSDYSSLMRLYVRPTIGKKKLTDLRPLDIQSVISDLQSRGLSARTIRYCHTVLSSALKQAVRWRVLTNNPAAYLELPKVRRKEMKSLSPEQAQRFLAECQADEYGLLFEFALVTYGGTIPWLTVKDLPENEYEVSDSSEHITPEAVARSSTNLIEPNCVIVATRVGLGKFAINSVPVAINQDLRALRPTNRVNTDFLLFAILNSLHDILKFKQGTTVKGIRKEDLLSSSIPLPPLPVQERIVEILQHADAIRRKRAESRHLADQILPAAFYDLFGDVAITNSSVNFVRLDDVADIKSGATKGRRFGGKETVTVPYLRVANVQEGFLDLSEIKTISVLPTDVEKFHLEDGDILMTEGGDPDKLGRGCIWRGEIDACIHQNHVFRVRADRSRLLPEFLAALLRTSYAKGYFLKAAKRSSNLASINSTQVKSFTFPLPPMEMQRRFLLRVEQWDSVVSQSTAAIHLAERAFTLILSRAFTGDLTSEWEATNADWIAERQAFYERLPRLSLLALLLERRERTGGEAFTLITALMKYAFLAQMEGELHRRLYRFVPYYYGPCAMELYDDVKALEREGLIAIENDAQDHKTCITLTRPDLAAALLQEEARGDDARITALDNSEQDHEAVGDPTMARLLGRRAELVNTLHADAVSILDAYGTLDHKHLLQAVYAKYPAYAKKSRILRKRHRPDE